MSRLRFEPLTADRFLLGEGARSISGRLHVVDIPAGRAYRYADGAFEAVVQSTEPLGAVAPVVDRPDEYVMAEGTAVTVARLGAGRERELRISLPTAAPGMRVNDAVVDPLGRFWVGTMPDVGADPVGAVYVVDHSGVPVTALASIPCPNGPAFGADGSVYLADSLGHRILRAIATPNEVPLFAEFATVEEGFPDGMTVDDEGCLWVAVWGAGEIRRFDTQGRVIERLATGASQPSSVCLIQLDGRRCLVVTSAAKGLSDAGEFDGAVLITEFEASAPEAVAWDPGGLLP